MQRKFIKVLSATALSLLVFLSSITVYAEEVITPPSVLSTEETETIIEKDRSVSEDVIQEAAIEDQVDRIEIEKVQDERESESRKMTAEPNSTSLGIFDENDWNYDLIGSGPNEEPILRITALKNKQLKNVYIPSYTVTASDGIERRVMLEKLSIFEENDKFQTFEMESLVFEAVAPTSKPGSVEKVLLDTQMSTSSAEKAISYQRALKHVDLRGLDTSQVTSMHAMFLDSTRIETVLLDGIDTSKVTDMSSMFNKTSNLKTVNLNTLDLSNVVSMSSMFEESGIRNLDLSAIDTSKVEDFSNFLKLTESLETLNIENFKTSSATNMSSMFQSLGGWIRDLDLTSFDTSKVTDMNNMFANTSTIETIDLSSFDTSKVESFAGMFQQKRNSMGGSPASYKELNLSSFDTSSAKDMSYMFYSLMLNQQVPGNNPVPLPLDISHFKMGNVENIDMMFQHTHFKTLDVSKWDTKSLKTAHSAFANMQNLNFIDPSNWNTEKLENISYMFSFDEQLQYIDMTNWKLNNPSALRATSVFFVHKPNNNILKTPIIIKTTDNFLTGYNYKRDNRKSAGPVKNAMDGTFVDNTTEQRYFNGYTINDESQLVITADQYNEFMREEPTPNKEKFEFSGWDPSYVSKTESTNLIEDNSVYNAQYEPIKLKVTFHIETAQTVVHIAPNTLMEASKIPLAKKAGYVFDKWVYLDNEAKVYTPSTDIITEDIDVKAVFKRASATITFIDGSVSTPVIGTYGELLNQSQIPQANKDGYTFIGWNTESTATNANYDPSTEIVSGDKTVYAIYRANTHTVTFETNGGSPIGNETVLENTAVTKPVDPTRDGYTFAGWYEDALLQTPFDFATLINADTTVYAKWEKIPVNYTVTFETNGGSPIGSETVLENTAVTKPADPTRDGYTFAGWYEDALLQTPFDFATLINADTTVYAKWEKIPVNYTITFETNGGSAIGSETVPENTAVTKPVDPTLVDHTFEGWFTDTTLQTPFDFATLINADTTLYAKWSTAMTPIDTYFTVNYESNGGSAIDSERVLANTKATQPNAPTRVDHTFEGWFTDATLQTPFDFATLINADITLYAKWSTSMTPIDTYFTVNYESNGGSAVDSERVLANTKATQPKAPTLVDHTFEGWFTDATLQTPFDFATLINADTTLYAKWSSNMTPIDPVKPKPIDPVKPKPIDPVKPKPIDPVKPTPVDPEPIVPTPVTPKPDVQEPGVETPKGTLPATGLDSNKILYVAISVMILGVALFGFERRYKKR